MDRLKQVAFEEGRTKGLAEAAESNETRAVELLPLLQLELDKAVQIERDKLKDITKEAALITGQVLEKVFPVLTNRGAKDEVCQFIETGLSQCPEEIRCIITVSPQIETDVKNYLTRLVPSH